MFVCRMTYFCEKQLVLLFWRFQLFHGGIHFGFGGAVRFGWMHNLAVVIVVIRLFDFCRCRSCLYRSRGFEAEVTWSFLVIFIVFDRLKGVENNKRTALTATIAMGQQKRNYRTLNAITGKPTWFFLRKADWYLAKDIYTYIRKVRHAPLVLLNVYDMYSSVKLSNVIKSIFWQNFITEIRKPKLLYQWFFVISSLDRQTYNGSNIFVSNIFVALGHSLEVSIFQTSQHNDDTENKQENFPRVNELRYTTKLFALDTTIIIYGNEDEEFIRFYNILYNLEHFSRSYPELVDQLDLCKINLLCWQIKQTDW